MTPPDKNRLRRSDFFSRLRAVRSAALTTHRAVIHYCRLRFAYPHKCGAAAPDGRDYTSKKLLIVDITPFSTFASMRNSPLWLYAR